MEQELRTFLRNIQDLAEIPVDWGMGPTNPAMPYVVLALVSDVPLHSQAGPEAFSEARVQIDVYSSAVLQSKNLANSIRRALDGAKFGTIDGVFLSFTRFSTEAGDTTGERIHRAQLDFNVFYQFT